MIGRLLRRARSAVWLLLLLAVPPGALIHFFGWPLPHHWPTRAQWGQWATQPLTRAGVIDLFAIAVWLMWAVFVYAVLADLSAWIARLARRGPRLHLPPLPAAVQATANGILGAAVFSAGTHPAHPTIAVPQPPVPAAAADYSTAPASPRSTTPAHPPAPVPGDPQGSDQHRVMLPDGGWVTQRTAAAVAASAAMLWRQRRLRYLPGPPRGAVRDDPDLTPLPATVTTIQTQLHPPPDQPPDPAHHRPPTDPSQTDPGPAVLGDTAGRALRPADLPTGGVGLTGPAALDAARGVLVAALLAGTGTPDDLRVVTTDDALTALLGVADDDTIPGLHRAPDIHDAINTVEAIALHRAADRYPHPTSSGPPAPHTTSPIVLITACPPDAATVHRLTVLLALAAQIGVTGVVLGPWPHRTTWHVEHGGTVHRDDAADTPLARLSVLNATATRDLLTLYRDTHQPTPQQPPITTPNRPVRPGQQPVATPRHSPTGNPDSGSPWFPPGPQVHLRVLGDPAVYPAATTTPIRLPRSAALPILVLLALHPNGLTTTDLATTLWPQLPARTITGRVYTTINTLRRALDPIAGAPTIIRAGERYRLDPQHVDVDIWRLHAAVDQATHATGPIEQRRALRQVIDTYTDELAKGWPWPWLDTHREALRRHVLDAHTALADPATAPAP